MGHSAGGGGGHCALLSTPVARPAGTRQRRALRVHLVQAVVVRRGDVLAGEPPPEGGDIAGKTVLQV